MADDEDAVLSDVDEDPLPPPSSSSSHKTLSPSQTQSQPQSQSDAQAQAQRLLDLAAELDEEHRLRRAAEDALADSESRLSHLKAFAQDVLRKRDDLIAEEKEHIGVLLRSALQASTSEVLKVAEDGLREAGIEIGLNDHREHRLGSVEKDEVYTLAGALENTMKESQVKIVELQHLVEALR